MLATRQIRMPIYVLSVFLLSIASTTVLAQEEIRTSTTVQYTKAQRDAGAAGTLSKDEYPGLQSKTGVRRSNSTASGDFWFYSADVLLFNDHDADGHFHGVDLLFDADTYYQEAEVYAVFYLSLEGGPWNEYSATENFLLFGSSADDEFQIVTELVSGYPTGSYDLLIELFDGYNDDFLASYGPVDTSELAFIPLEDANRDVPYVPPPTTVIVHDGGGSLGWLSLLALLAGLRAKAFRPDRATGYWAN
jgi:hypothetical protein